MCCAERCKDRRRWVPRRERIGESFLGNVVIWSRTAGIIYKTASQERVERLPPSPQPPPVCRFFSHTIEMLQIVFSSSFVLNVYIYIWYIIQVYKYSVWYSRIVLFLLYNIPIYTVIGNIIPEIPVDIFSKSRSNFPRRKWKKANELITSYEMHSMFIVGLIVPTYTEREYCHRR